MHNDPLARYLQTREHRDLMALVRTAGLPAYAGVFDLLGSEELAKRVVYEVFMRVASPGFRPGTFRSGVGLICCAAMHGAFTVAETLISADRKEM